MTALQVGDIAPDFHADSTSGTLHLAKLAAKCIVLYFYPKDMTLWCTIQAREFSQLYSQFQDLDVIVIGVSKDHLSSHDQFCANENIPFPLLVDTDGAICREYGVIKEKSMFGKGYLGMHRTTFLIGGDRQIIKIWKSVKPVGHAQKVLDVARIMSQVQG